MKNRTFVSWELEAAGIKDDAAGSLHGFLNTLLRPMMDAAEKEMILAQEYGLDTVSDLGEELKQMCNLSEAIEEKGIESGIKKGILLAKKVLRLSAEGKNEAEIARLCGISVEKVHDILTE